MAKNVLEYRAGLHSYVQFNIYILYNYTMFLVSEGFNDWGGRGYDDRTNASGI